MARVTFKEADLSAKLRVMNEEILSRRAPVPVAVKKIVKVVKASPGKEFIENVLREHRIDFIKEHVFSPTRKFRFDYCFEHDLPHRIKVAIEYEGIYAGKSRHTSLTGYTRDTVKYNLAALEGWIVLRYTAKSYKQFAVDIKRILQ